MLGANVWFVYLAGGIKRDETKIRAFSGAAKLSLYDAKVMMGAPGPRKVAAFAKEEEAGELVLQLRQAGLNAVVVDKSRFSRLPKIFRAHKAVEAPDGLTFTIETAGTGGDAASRTFELPQPRGFVRAVVLGFYTQTTTHTERGRSKFSLSSSSKSQVREAFIHLYSEDPHTVLEIHGQKFEFPWLQQMGTVSGDLRFKQLAERLSFYYNAKLDDTLYKTPEEVNAITAALNVESTHGQSNACATTGSSSSDDSPHAMAASRIIVYSLAFGL